MAKRYSAEWKKNVSDGLKRYRRDNPCTDEEKRRLSEYAKKGNLSRAYKKRPISELKSPKQVRGRLFAKRGRKCERCGWEEVNPFYDIVPVQVNHKDGNPGNNNEDNLEILCPNCHSLTEYYMCFGRRPSKPNSRTLKRYKSWSNKGL